MLIVVTTVALSDGGEIAPPELIARGFGENEELLEELRDEADRIAEELAEDGITEIKLLQEHMHDAIAKLGLRPNAAPADDSSRGDRGL